MMEYTKMVNMTPQEEINMYRRSVLIHSCLYYFLDSPIISDQEYDIKARKLDALHKQYPEVSVKCVYQEAFKDFSPATGYDLPIKDTWVIDKARYLLRIHQAKQREKPVVKEKVTKKEDILMSLDLNNLFK